MTRILIAAGVLATALAGCAGTERGDRPDRFERMQSETVEGVRVFRPINR